MSIAVVDCRIGGLYWIKRPNEDNRYKWFCVDVSTAKDDMFPKGYAFGYIDQGRTSERFNHLNKITLREGLDFYPYYTTTADDIDSEKENIDATFDGAGENEFIIDEFIEIIPYTAEFINHVYDVYSVCDFWVGSHFEGLASDDLVIGGVYDVYYDYPESNGKIKKFIYMGDSEYSLLMTGFDVSNNCDKYVTLTATDIQDLDGLRIKTEKCTYKLKALITTDAFRILNALHRNNCSLSKSLIYSTLEQIIDPESYELIHDNGEEVGELVKKI